jgi:hypothetical protein
MNTPVEYVKLSEAELEKLRFTDGNSEVDDKILARAQVYATLAQASATVELQKSVRVTNSGVGW